MGGPAMLRRLSVTPAAQVRDAAERAASRGQAAVYLLTSMKAIAAFAVADAYAPNPATPFSACTISGSRLSC
jgi:Cu2+-exporting ATPase